MSLALSELIQTAAVGVAAFGVLVLLAVFLKAEAAAGRKAGPPDRP